MTFESIRPEPRVEDFPPLPDTCVPVSPGKVLLVQGLPDMLLMYEDAFGGAFLRGYDWPQWTVPAPKGTEYPPLHYMIRTSLIRGVRDKRINLLPRGYVAACKARNVELQHFFRTAAILEPLGIVLYYNDEPSEPHGDDWYDED